MGWLFLNPAPFTPKQYLDAQCNYPPDPERGRTKGLRTLKSTIRGTVYYAACQYYDDTAADDVFAIIILTQNNARAADGLTFGYKDMDENMGPYYYGCPASILDLLSPTTNENALKWRAECRSQATLAARRKPSPGDTIILETPLRFTDGVEAKTFVATEHNSRLAFLRKTDNQLVMISKFMERQWKLVPALSLSR